MKKETLVQVFSCTICEIFKNKFFKEHTRETASDGTLLIFEHAVSKDALYS